MARRLTSSERTTYRRLFPNLNLDAVWVLGEATPRYNCLAWALGRTDAWVWPWGQSNATHTQMTNFLSARGYRVAFGGPLATYGPGSIAHAARFTNTWTSKCGAQLLITHSLTGINGGTYGTLRQQYARRSGVAAALVDQDAEVVAGEPSVEPFSEAELQAVMSAVEAIDPGLRDRFQTAYAAWRGDWTWQPLPPTQVESFADLVSLGPDIVPLLVDVLTDADAWPAVFVLEHLLPAGFSVAFDLDDPNAEAGEQHRARQVALGWVRARL